MPRPKEFNPNDALDKAMQVFWHKGYEATSKVGWPIRSAAGASSPIR